MLNVVYSLHMTIGQDLKDLVSIFQYPHYFAPARLNELQPSLNDIDELRMLPFLDSNIIVKGLKLALVDGVSEMLEPLLSSVV